MVGVRRSFWKILRHKKRRKIVSRRVHFGSCSSECKTQARADQRVVGGFIRPYIPAIYKDAGGRAESPLESGAGMAQPFVNRISATATAAKYVWRQTDPLKGPAEYHTACDGVHKMTAVIGHVDVCADAYFAREEVVQTYDAAPTAMTDVPSAGSAFVRGPWITPLLLAAFLQREWELSWRLRHRGKRLSCRMARADCKPANS